MTTTPRLYCARRTEKESNLRWKKQSKRRRKNKMGKTRQTFSKEFKAKIALEALREESTIQQLSVKYRVHPKV